MTDNPSLIESAGGNKADVISDPPKERKRAESLTMDGIALGAISMPELVQEGDRVWLTAIVNGCRERICEVSVSRCTLISKQAASIVWALAGR